MKIKEKKLIFFMSVLAILHPIFNYSFRLGHVFVDVETFMGFSSILLGLMVLNAALWISMFRLRVCEKLSPKQYKIIFYIACVFQALFLIINLAYIYIGKDNLHIFYFYFKPIFFYALVLLGSLFVIFALPKTGGLVKKAISISLAIIISLSVAVKAFDISIFRFETQPSIFIADDTYYSVVWATNKKATGAVSYNFEGQDYLVYDALSGNIRSDSRIHTVKVPREHLDGNNYKIMSARVYEHLGNSAKVGKQKFSDEYQLKKYTSGQDIVALSFSDWHDNRRKAVSAAKHLSEPDIFYMLGDAMNMINSEDTVIDYLLKPTSEITKSACPTVFVRGNHEARGEYAINLQKHLGLSKYYYTYSWGPISGVVFDSGEDKADDHIEYGGLVSFDSYRLEQDKWFTKLKTYRKSAYVISACHDIDISDAWTKKLNKLGTGLMLSGHKHRFEFIEAEPKTGAKFPTIIDGGKTGRTYIATEIILSGKTMTVKAVKSNGEVMYQAEHNS